MSPIGDSSAWAGDGDTFRPVLQYVYHHDDNLFRLADTSPGYALGKSDNYQTLGAGAEVDWKQGRQRILLDALVSQTRFDKYSLLDFDGKNVAAEWQWELGNRLNGQLGTKYSTTLGTFLDIVGLVSNVRTQREHFVNADYWFHTNWTAEASAHRRELDYSAASQAFSNSSQDELAAGIFYRGGEIDRIGLEFSTLDGQFPDRPVGGASATRYDANVLRLVANWRITGKSRLRGRIGYISRDDNRAGNGGFSGVNGRLDWEWVPSGKTLVNIAAYRELKNSERAGTEFLQVTGASARVTWLLASKVTLGASIGTNNNLYSGSILDEDVINTGMDITYSPWPGGNVALGVQHQTRDSNVPNRVFDATMLTLSAVLRF